MTDGIAIALLTGAYNEPVDLASTWQPDEQQTDHDDAEQNPRFSRTICSDSGQSDKGQRLIAVCTSFENAGHAQAGLVDLWQLLPADAQHPAPRIGARKNGIESNGWGSPGEVRLLAIGPQQRAFVVTSGFSNMGEMVESQTLYIASDSDFAAVLSFTSAHNNGGWCDPDEDAGCREKLYSNECALKVGTQANAAGFYDLRLDTTMERNTGRSQQDIVIPNRSGEYDIPQPRIDERCGSI